MDQLISTITKILNHPLLSWGTLPFSITMFGTVVGATQTGFKLFSFLLLYLFLLGTSLLERILMKKTKQPFDSPGILNNLFWLTLLLILILVWTTVNWLSVGLFVLYLLFIYLAYHPALKMEQTIYYVILQLFFKVILMSYLSFYLQTGFLEANFLLYLIPLVLIFLSLIIYRQRGMFNDKYSRYQYFITLYSLPTIIVSYFIGIIFMLIILVLQGANITQIFLFSFPLLFMFILLAVKKFRLKMRTDNYLNLVIMFTVVLYAVIMEYPK